MSDREEKTGKNDNGKKNKGGKRNKIVAIEMIILVLLIMVAVAIFIQRDKSVKEAAKIHNQKAKKTEQTPQAAQKENEIEEETEGKEEETGDRDASVSDRSNFAVQPGVSVGTTEQSDEKIVYLTLDDGPSDNTQAVLDILDKYNAKATFFVTGEMPEYKDMIKATYDKGHTIGMHTYSHDYAKVYASVDAYFQDLDQIGQMVQEEIGYVPCFVRFPGFRWFCIWCCISGIRCCCAAGISTRGTASGGRISAIISTLAGLFYRNQTIGICFCSFCITDRCSFERIKVKYRFHIYRGTCRVGITPESECLHIF